MNLRFPLVLLFLVLLVPNTQAQVEGREWEEIGKPKDIQKVLKFMPEGTDVKLEMVPMKDGVRLATNIFIPPGDGPFPVLFCRGYYGRFGTSYYAAPCKEGGLVFIIQDARGSFDSEGKGTFETGTFRNELSDIDESLNWIASQPWCNGRIGMTGGSGNGIGPSAAFLTGNKHLVSSSPGNSTGSSLYWMFDNRVRRNLYSWMKNHGHDTKAWPRPTLTDTTRESELEYLASLSPNPETVYVEGAGWWDIVGESALDYFRTFSKKSKIYVKVSPLWHGGKAKVDGKAYPYATPPKPTPSATGVLKGEAAAPTDSSFLVYYVMGDVHAPDGPGNTYKLTTEWPVPHTPTPYYFSKDGGLSTTKPSSADASLTFTFDPKKPTPAMGGNSTYNPVDGPHDQSFLKDRTEGDVLRFVTGPLEDPVIITGNVFGDLHFSTDVKDTLFIVKLVDIYPSGYEALIRESAGMARYSEGLDGSTPVEPGRPYHLKIDMWSTAIAFNKGHRIGVYVTSSAVIEDPKKKDKTFEVYETHPNTFEQVDSFDNSPTATQTIHLSASHPSGIILPVVSE